LAVRGVISDALAREERTGPVSVVLTAAGQLSAVDAGGNGAKARDELADMWAQTLVYGVLVDRLMAPDGPDAAGASAASAGVAQVNPALATVLDRVTDMLTGARGSEPPSAATVRPGSGTDRCGAGRPPSGEGLEQLRAELRVTPVEAIFDLAGAGAGSGSTSPGGDLVVRFYEEFLREYDGITIRLCRARTCG
jgi:hypothetical protein